MFWKIAGLSATSPIDSILDKSAYTLEELLDEDQIIQECKAANSRLINFLQAKPQVEQMIRYIIEEAPEAADSKRAFKYPFVSCQIFTCEIEGILKAVAEDDQVLDLLFSFLDPKLPHGALLSGYFSKVVICLLMKRNGSMMQYLRSQEGLLASMINLIGITSIKEVLMRLVSTDDHIYAFWLADSNLLEMLVDKLRPEHDSEVHANAAEILSAITGTAPSALASKLASPRFVDTVFNHALEDPKSRTSLIYSLSVCISLLDPRRARPMGLACLMRSQQQHADTWSPANPETVETMLQRLGDLLRLLEKSQDPTTLPTTYGELKPPFGIHRLKIVEFVAVLLRTNVEAVRQEVIKQQALQLIVGLFFEFPFNNMLHTQVESIINSCIDNGSTLVDNLFADCDFISRLLAANEYPYASNTRPSRNGKPPTRVGNIGHLTRIANKIVQAAATNSRIQSYLHSDTRWSQWQTTVLHQRNMLENVYHWACGRPTAIRDRPVESDDDEFRDRDYDVSRMASNLTRDIFRYDVFDKEENEELPGSIERDDEDVFFDDETAEVVISSIRLSDDQDSFEEGSTPAWFAFREGSFISGLDNEANMSSPSSSGSDEVDEENDLADTATSSNGKFSSRDEVGIGPGTVGEFSADDLTNNAAFNLEYFSGPPTDWANFQEYDRKEDFGENNPFTVNFDPSRVPSSDMVEEQGEVKSSSPEYVQVEPEEAVQNVVALETEGTAKAMEHALKEGIVGEAGPLKPKATSADVAPQETPNLTDKSEDAPQFNDVNYWRSDYESTVVEEQQ